MAEIIYGTVSSILFKLGSDACQEFKANKELELDLKKLQSTLGPYKSSLIDADQAGENSGLVKDWISRLQDAVYDADDLLDEFQYKQLREQVRTAERATQVLIKPFSFLKQFPSRSKMSHRIKEIRERLKELTEEISTFKLVKSEITGKSENIEIMGVRNTWRETDSSIKSQIIGRDHDRDEIIKLLQQPTSDQDNISIVAIVGFGGLGKTALAQLVYNEPSIEKHFSQKFWVCVSENFDNKLLIKKILKSVPGKEGIVDNLDLQQLQTQVREVLRGKKYLIVLDDVWNDDCSNWYTFLGYLVDGAPGSKILVTTRTLNVALAMGINTPYVLKGLSRDQSWDLFKHVVAFRGQNKIDTKLELIGKKVVERCKGVPLAIITVAGLMRRNPNERFWSSIEENQEVWKSVKTEQSIMPVLKLSYNHLPSHLRPCFAFCSIFPKDFEIPKYKLIQLWNAQGYIQPSTSSNNRSLDLGDEYYKYLLSRSFFQEEKDYSFGITCKMHDLIHDLAQLVAGSSFSTVKDDKQKIPKEVRHLFLECQPSQNFETKGIRTILKHDLVLKKNVIESYSSLNYLRMLDLKWTEGKMLPNSIGKLKHLRFLDLSDNYNIEVLPDSITNLHNLQTLLLKNCMNLKKLPKDISKLISLECLNVKGSKLKYLPKGLGKLTSLQILSNFIVNTDDANEFSTLNELKDLNYLGGNLEIENLDMMRNVELESNLKEKKYLASLTLVWGNPDRNNEKDELLLDNLEPHPNLKKLEIIGYKGTRFSSWLSSLTNLTSLCIIITSSCCSQQLPQLDNLAFLESIELRGLSALEYVNNNNVLSLSCSTSTTTMFFPSSLKELILSDCENLKGWWRRKNKNEESTSELPCFPCLSSLEIWNCPNLTSMPLFPALDDLTLWKASIIPFQQTLTMKANKTSSASSSSSSSSCSTAPPLSNLKTLNLEGIDDLETLPEEFLLNLTSLESLKFKGCNKLECLPPKRPHCLIPTLTSLKTLKIVYCPQVPQLPRLDHLPFLVSIELRGLSALEYVEDDGIGKEEDPSSSLSCSTSTTTMFFPSLKKLILRDCENQLKGWRRRKNKNEESTSELPCFPCLSSLKISHCPNLTSMPLFPSLDDLTLRKASIIPFQQTLTMKANKTSTASSSSSSSCSTAPPLSNLKTLNLEGIDDLETLPEEFLLNLTSLERLTVKWQDMTALPEWILTLTSLKILQINDCPQVQSLPGEMHRLTSLKELIIYKCPKLSEACKEGSGIQWPQIAKIPNIFIQDRWVRGEDECGEHYRLV